MPGKKKGGKRRNNVIKTRRLEDITKDFDPKTFEVYGKVTKILGSRRFNVSIQNLNHPSDISGTIICSIKGSYRRNITVDMYVLVKLFDFNINQGQIIDSYNPDEVAALKTAEKWDYPTDSMTELNVSSDSDDDTEVLSELIGIDLDIDAI